MNANQITMNRPLMTALSAAMLAGTVGATAAAQSQPVDRKILAVSITPTSVAGDSFFDIVCHFSVAVGPTSAPVNASTQVLLFKNGGEVPIASLTVGFLADGGSGFCGAGSCGASCGSGYINGVHNTMLCLSDPPGCECRFPSIAAELPPVPLEEGDVVSVILFPAPGSIPEPVGQNDKWSTAFDGNYYFWRRQANQVELAPASSGAPGLVDVLVKGDVAWHGLMGPTDLGFEVQLVDAAGNVVASKLVSGSVLPSTDPLACGGLGCGALCGWWNGFQVDCANFPNIVFVPCACGGDWFAFFPDMAPGAVGGGTIVIAPIPGGLPELPGLEQQPLPIPSPCQGDLDGNGFVNGADLVIVLGTWGTNGAGDVNNDGIVNGEDLALVLGNWGACDPV